MKNKFIFFAFLFFFAAHIKAQTIITIAGTGSSGYNGDAIPATTAQLHTPNIIAIDSSNNIYIADEYNHRIRKIGTDGIIYTIAGTGTGGYTTDGIAATASELFNPYGIAVDLWGNVYIGDQGNNRVRKIGPDGIINTISGTGIAGYSGDGIAATVAQLNVPDGLAADNAGNIYVADHANDRIRKIDATGIITTFAGTGTAGYTGDGLAATVEEINHSSQVAIDAAGNVYITDGNGRARMVGTDGIIHTIAGTGVYSSTGDGGPATAATFEFLGCVIADSIGNIYLTDGNTNVVRKIDRYGIINTIAGTGATGHSGDGGPATAAEFNNPRGLAVDIFGDVYITEVGSNYIREIVNGNHLPAIRGGHAQALSACAGTAISIDTLLKTMDADAGQPLTWTLMAGPYHGTSAAAYTTSSSGSSVYPIGLSYTAAAGYTGNDTFTVRVDDGYSVYTTTIYVAVSNCSLGATNTLQPTEAVKVFPNPNEGTFTIQPSASGIATKIVITNAVGSIVKEMSITKATDIKLNVPAGVYTVSATANGNKQVVKVVVE